jgi:hypothetical protein
VLAAATAGVVAIGARVAGMELKRNMGYSTAECDGRRAFD